MAISSPVRLLQTEVERAGLVAVAIRATQVHGVDAALAQLFDRSARDAFGLVRRVVEHLQLEAIARVIEGAGGVEQATHDGRLVVQRELHGDGRQLALRDSHRARCTLDPALVAQALKNQRRAMRAVSAEDEQDGAVQRKEDDLHASSSAVPNTEHLIVIEM